jgi:GTP pyrophosphokinase
VIHVHDCPGIPKNRGSSDSWLDVAWDKNITRQFETSIRLMVANKRGVLARVAASIADSGSNIDNVAMEGDGTYTIMTFTLQVRNRLNLAQVMRALRRIPEVERISRVRADGGRLIQREIH